MSCIKLKNTISFDELLQYGFIEDAANCEHPEDHYYFLNNYYYQANEDFRIVINTLSRKVEIFCLAEESGLNQMSELIPLMELIEDGLLRIVE